MVNGLGVLGWGVGGIEAEAAMLGQPVTMLIPQVDRLQAHGQARRRRHGHRPRAHRHARCCASATSSVKFVEFFGDGLAGLPLADRATIGNMSPEFGSTVAIFPIDGETLRYLELSGRSKARIELVEAYAKRQGMWRQDGSRLNTPICSSSTSAPSSLRSRARAARRIASRSRT